MSKFENRGTEIRKAAKELVLDFMQSIPECRAEKKGIKQAQIFKQCEFDWGDREVATSSNQQYWIAAILWGLQEEGKIERVKDSGPWRLV